MFVCVCAHACYCLVLNHMSSRFLLAGQVDLFLMASNQASMDQWILAITNVIQGYHIVKSIVEEVQQEATVILTETEETCETLCLICKFW